MCVCFSQKYRSYTGINNNIIHALSATYGKDRLTGGGYWPGGRFIQGLFTGAIDRTPPISHRLRDKRRFPSKIAHFHTPRPVNIPDDGVPYGIWYRRKGSQMLLCWGCQMVEKVLR